MLVMSRQVGQSLRVDTAEASCVVTLLRVSLTQKSVTVLINRTQAGNGGALESFHLELSVNGMRRIASDVQLGLLDARSDKARLGIATSKQSGVHRLEVYEALREQGPGDGEDPEEGLAGSGVPRPPVPPPPGSAYGDASS